ncbi:E3 ubiquitin-protein ligase XIAP-like [Saccostrea echinata]|uniref:E3 ubiquitin-protein ligase XIAP-like n=1 Tax=Saccostrea echinata TaxID=191078 RepID=UPI002A80D2ED|nr:E3 ubiquitin-protein ligase XIAP-like [Saccostrea echinata]
MVCKTSPLLVVSVDYREMKGCIIAKPMFELKASTFQIEITLYNMLLEFNSCFNRARKMHRIYLLKQLLKITDEEHISKIAKNLQSKENIQIPNKNENKHYSSAHKTDIYHLWKKAKFKNSVMTKTIAFFQNHEPDCLNDSETLGERKHKEWLSCDFEKFSEISIFPVFRSNDLEYSFQQILNGTPYLSSEVMRFEHHRLSSFANYNSIDTPSVLVMAKAGWYATGNGRETKTFCCMISNSAWKKEDDPFHVHKELYYDCAFILGTDLDHVSIQKENPECQRKNSDANNSNISEISTNVQNMRIVSSKSNLAEKLEESHMGNQSEIEKFSELSSKSTQNTSTTLSIDCPSRPSSASRRGDSFPRDVSIDRNRRAQKSGLNEAASYQNDNDKRKIEFSDSDDGSTHIFREPILPPLDFEKPKHIEYSTVGIRASSFSGFPISSRKTPKEFAVGGFYYRGFGDRTTCFHCGISLQGWSVEDDVFVEHVRYNPLCQYMRRLKGDEFIKLVMAATHNLQLWCIFFPAASQNSSAKDIASTLKEMGFSQSAISAALGRVATKNDCLTIQGILDVIVENTDIVQRNSANNQSTSTANEENGENLNSQESLANTRLSGSTTTGFSTDLSSASKSDLTLKDQFICKICMDERVGVVFTPCGHIVTCSKCSKSLRKCPICRENIRDKVRTVITD